MAKLTRDLPFALVTRMQYTQFFKCLLSTDSCHTFPKDSVRTTCVEDRLSQDKKGATEELTPRLSLETASDV